MNTSNHKNSRSDNEDNTSETIKNEDTLNNQHPNNSSEGDQYRFSKEHTSDKDSDKEDDFDPYFQKNSDIAQDLHEDLKKTVDPDRKKNDEYSINTPGTVNDENGENHENS